MATEGETGAEPAPFFVFRRGHADAACYGRMARWMARVLRGAKFGCAHADDYDRVPAGGVHVVCFDEALEHVLPAWGRLSAAMARFVLIESEPQCNLAIAIERLLAVLRHGCAGVITLNAGNVGWWRAALDARGLAHVPVAFWPQGHMPSRPAASPAGAGSVASGGTGEEEEEEEEEEKAMPGGDAAPTDDARPYDVAMPGCANSAHRVAVVAALRERGLAVDVTPAYGADLDRAMASARLFVYCPWGPTHRHFATQRVLWAVDAGACVVGVRSDDAEMERLYGPLYVACDSHEDLPGVCRTLVDSGAWRTVGARARRAYVERFDALALLRASDVMGLLASLVRTYGGQDD